MSVICAGKVLVILKVGGVWGENAGDGAENTHAHTHTCLETASIYRKWEKDYDRGCVPILDIGSHFVASARQLPYIVYCSNLNVDSRKVCNNAATLLSMQTVALDNEDSTIKVCSNAGYLAVWRTDTDEWLNGQVLFRRKSPCSFGKMQVSGCHGWVIKQWYSCDHSSVAT